MARTKTRWPQLDLEPLVEMMGGMDAVIRQLGVKRVIDEVGVKRVIDEVGAKRVIHELGVETFLDNLSPGERRELKRRLAEQ